MRPALFDPTTTSVGDAVDEMTRRFPGPGHEARKRAARTVNPELAAFYLAVAAEYDRRKKAALSAKPANRTARAKRAKRKYDRARNLRRKETT